jgi:fructokinase
LTDRNRVVCLGEALVDFVSDGPVGRLTDSRAFAPRFGGSQANIAVGASRFGASAALAGCAGTDPWGQWLRGMLEREAVDVSLFELRGNVQTQHAFVAVSPQGEPEFSFFGAMPDGCLPAGAEIHSRLRRGPPGVLVFGSDTLIAEPDRELVADLVGAARPRGWQVLFDPNLRAGRWQAESAMHQVALEAMEGVTVVKANASEAVALTGLADLGDAARALCSLGAQSALVTAGADGAFLARDGGVPEHIVATQARVLDATGAGDAVAAVLGAALARGGLLDSVLVEVAMRVASRVVTERGALAGLPGASEARAMLDPLVPAQRPAAG